MGREIGKAEGFWLKRVGVAGKGKRKSGRGDRAKNVRPENKRRRGETEKLGEGRGEKIGMARMGKGKGGENGVKENGRRKWEQGRKVGNEGEG